MKKYTIKDNLGNKKTVYAKDLAHAMKLNDAFIKDFEPFFFKEDETFKADADYIGERLKIENFIDEYNDYEDFVDTEFTAKVLGGFGNPRENNEMRRYFEEKWPQKAKLAHKLFDSMNSKVKDAFNLKPGDVYLTRNNETTVFKVLKIDNTPKGFSSINATVEAYKYDIFSGKIERQSGASNQSLYQKDIQTVFSSMNEAIKYLQRKAKQYESFSKKMREDSIKDANRPKTFKFFINNRAVSEDEYTKSFIKEAAREHQSARTAQRVINEDKESAKVNGKNTFMSELGRKFSIVYDSKVKDEANLPTTLQALVNDEEAAIKAYEVAIKNLEGKIDEDAKQVLINIMKDERRHVENLYAILNGQVTEKNLEDSIHDAFIVKADNAYIMESDRPEMTSLRKYAKLFTSKKEAIDYARKYFRLSPIDIEIIEE